MSTRQLIVRSLRHYWRTGLAVSIGLAIACAVIVGSLVVGDSVRGSIRDTALARLGRTTHALIAPHFFRQQLAQDMMRNNGLGGSIKQIVPAVITRGFAANASTDAAVPNANVIGIDDSFKSLWPDNTAAKLTLSQRQSAVSAALARDLGVKLGDSILINVDRQSAVPSGTLFERRSREETMSSMRLEITAILPDNGPGGFKLDASTDAPRNVFVSRDWLCSEMGKPGKANAMLAVSSTGGDIADAASLAVKKSATFEDRGLKLVPNPDFGYVSLESDGVLLTPTPANGMLPVGIPRSCTSVYLATMISKAGSAQAIPYSIVAAAEPFRPFTFRAGADSASHMPDSKSIWLSAWAADDLQAKIGDNIKLAYLVSKPDGTYREDSITLTLSGIIQMSGSALDRGLVPAFEGISDAERIDEWSAPFPVDLDRIRPQDEAYWDRYKTTPKAFVSFDTARELWAKGSSGPDFGGITSIRYRPSSGESLAQLQRKLASSLSGSTEGLVFRPIRQIALAASAGTTDFGQLFLGMSFFLVIAGACLAGTLMRLSAERRASEAGIMMACGFDARQTRRALFAEGLCLTIFGVMLGTPLGVLYAAGIIAALRSWWIGAVGTSMLWLHITPESVMIGAISGLAVGAISVYMGVSKLSHSQVLDLLAGWQSMAILPKPHIRMRARLALISSLTLAIVLITISLISKSLPPQAAFFACGALLIVAGISAADLTLTRSLSGKPAPVSIKMLALRSAAANRTRSLLVIGLIATASFMIVAVAANTRNFSRIDYTRKDSGTGGFALRAISSLPIRYDFGTPEGRKALGFPPEDEASFEGVKVYRFLMSSGDDVSCVNLVKPTKPRILSVGRDFIDRGGFSVTTEVDPGQNPWKALLTKSDSVSDPDSIVTDPEMAERDNQADAVFGDADSVMWSLHSGLGSIIHTEDADGRPATLRIEGLIHSSIFAGELLRYGGADMPGSSARCFLIEAPKDKVDKVAQSLRENLGDMGLQVRTTRELLDSYMSVQNTYLSVFLALGGLGLMLGTFGLVAVLLRSALERRREFALMLATGLTNAHITRLLIIENAGLLLYGLICGTISALVAVAPHVLSTESGVGWGMIAASLAAIAIVGLASCALAAKHVVNGALVQALREE